MGISYPANAGWRLWALAKCGRTDIVLKEFREKWAKFDSVILNNTLQEYWTVKPDSDSEWSHCPVAPLYVLYMSLAGIKPLTHGFSKCEIRPQLYDIENIDLKAYTIKGPITFKSNGKKGDRELIIKLPDKCMGELIIKRDEEVNLKLLTGVEDFGNSRYLIPSGKEIKIRLKYT
jgi:alpha-L-rhamnosidase